MKRLARQRERPAALGELEITVTPVGPLDGRNMEAYAAAGVHRLVFLPKPDASHAERHSSVPLDQILRNIETIRQVAETLN